MVWGQPPFPLGHPSCCFIPWCILILILSLQRWTCHPPSLHDINKLHVPATPRQEKGEITLGTGLLPSRIAQGRSTWAGGNGKKQRKKGNSPKYQGRMGLGS